MKTKNLIHHRLSYFSIALLIASMFTGCQSVPEKTIGAPAVINNTESTAIRIKAGGDGFKDSTGNTWLPDQGFIDGDTTERPELTITNTADQRIYQSERYGMTQFSQALPNGSYTVKLHFCETYDGITGPGERVFSFNVAGHEFKNFDVWAKAGGAQRAYVETVPVDITDGKLLITFTPQVENPQINGIEILPVH